MSGSRKLDAKIALALRLPPRDPGDLAFDHQSFSPRNTALVVIHTITEVRMGWYFGELGILKPEGGGYRVIFEDRQVLYSHSQFSPVSWLSEEVCAVKRAGVETPTGRTFIAFLLVDVTREAYAVLAFPNVHSFLVTQDAEGMIRTRNGSDTVGTCPLRALEWHPLAEIGDFDAHVARRL